MKHGGERDLPRKKCQIVNSRDSSTFAISTTSQKEVLRQARHKKLPLFYDRPELAFASGRLALGLREDPSPH
jgi:hypothetical protein